MNQNFIGFQSSGSVELSHYCSHGCHQTAAVPPAGYFGEGLWVNDDISRDDVEVVLEKGLLNRDLLYLTVAESGCYSGYELFLSSVAVIDGQEQS